MRRHQLSEGCSYRLIIITRVEGAGRAGGGVVKPSCHIERGYVWRLGVIVVRCWQKLHLFCVRWGWLQSEQEEQNAEVTHIQVQKNEKNVLCVLNTHQSHKAYCAYLFNVCSNHAPFKLRWTRILKKKKTNLHFMILTYLWPWNRVKVIKLGMNCWTPSKVICLQSLTDPP